MIAPVSAIADVLALWGRDGWLTPPLRPVVPAAAPRLARVRTVEMASAPAGAGLGPVYDLLSKDLTDEVVLVAAADVAGAVWGEILATAAAGSGATAVLVDGRVRDAPDMQALGLPVYAVDHCVVGPAGAGHVVTTDEPVTVGSVLVAPGDHVVVDATGCVRIAAADLDDVLAAAARYAAAEDAVLDALVRGEPLTAAYQHKKSIVDELRR